MWYRASACATTVANRAHCRRNPRGDERKGNRGGNYPKNWMLAVANVRGALVPNISGSTGTDCGPLRRRHSAEKAVPLPSAARRLLNLLLTEGGGYRPGGWFMNEIARSKRIKNVVSLQVARERRHQPRGDSNRHAQLRGSVVELALQIQALRDALGRPQPPRLRSHERHS